jgi:dihydrofolate reductase
LIVSLIVALDEDGGIGKKGGLPWRLSADLKNFKSLTMGHYLILGRKTYESIGRSLPGRRMVVVTRKKDFTAPGCLVAHSLADALSLAEKSGEDEVFIGGGGEIFTQALPLAERIYLTRVHTRASCDVFFPELDGEEWQEIERKEHPADEKNECAFTFYRLDRVHRLKK